LNRKIEKKRNINNNKKLDSKDMKKENKHKVLNRMLRMIHQMKKE